MGYININNICQDDFIDYKKDMEDELILEYEMELIQESNYREHQLNEEFCRMFRDY